jgi:hypothetical protein
MKSATWTFSPPLSPRTLDGIPYFATPSLNNFNSTSLLLLFLMPIWSDNDETIHMMYSSCFIYD